MSSRRLHEASLRSRRLAFRRSARIEVVRFVEGGGLAPLLAPGRGMYGSVWSAAFQRCKKRAKILKWRQMRAFSGSVSEWCDRAVPARLLPGSCPVPAQRPVPARFLPGSCPVPARFLPGSCPTAGQDPPRSGGSCAGAGPSNQPRTTLGCCTPRLCGWPGGC